MRENQDFLKKLGTLVLPIALQQLLLALVSASDALMLGWLTQDALSAVSLAGQIAFVQNLFLAAMTIGLSILAAQFWGKGDADSFEKIFAYVLGLTAAVSLLFTAAALCAPAALMRIFTADPVLIEKGAVYLRAVSPSYFLTGVSQIYLCMLKNSGRAVQSSAISAFSVALNIGLNAALIFGLLGLPRMEIAGAALATVLARLTEVLWGIRAGAGKSPIKLRRENCFGCGRALRQNFWKHTTPVLGNEIVWGTGFTMYSVLMGHLGSDAVAANSLANIVRNLIACFCIGLASGGGILVGNELGAGRLAQAKAYGKKLCGLAVALGAVSACVLLALIPVILPIARLSDTASVYLRGMLVLCAGNMIGMSVNSTAIAGIFCAGGDARFGFRCDAVTMWGIIVPLSFIAAFVWKLPVLAVYAILSMDEIVKLPAVYRNYKKYKWVKNLTLKEEF